MLHLTTPSAFQYTASISQVGESLHAMFQIEIEIEND
jgi:hypothetical protein